jgi:hypothetical protein
MAEPKKPNGKKMKKMMRNLPKPKKPLTKEEAKAIKGGDGPISPNP